MRTGTTSILIVMTLLAGAATFAPVVLPASQSREDNAPRGIAAQASRSREDNAPRGTILQASRSREDNAPRSVTTA